MLIVTIVVGCGAGPQEPSGAPHVDPCPASDVIGDGDACQGLFPYGVTVPPNPAWGIDGLATSEIGDQDRCTCVEPSLEEACAAVGWPGGCPTAYEHGEADGERWSVYQYCTDIAGVEYLAEHNVPTCPRGEPYGSSPFGGVEYRYFRLDGEVPLVAIEVVAQWTDQWCCGGSTTTRRWIGDPILFAHCEGIVYGCD